MCLTLGDRTLWLVGKAEIERVVTEADAATWVAEVTACWSGAEGLARLVDASLGPVDDPDEMRRFATAELASGRWRILRISEASGGRPIVHPDALLDGDWDAIPMLSDSSRPARDIPRRHHRDGGSGNVEPAPSDSNDVHDPLDAPVVEPKLDALVFTCDRFGFDSAIPRAGFPALADGQREATTGIGELSQVLRHLREHADDLVVVIGHADENGKAAHNHVLSQQRALGTAALLHGRRDDFLAVCDAAASLVDLKHALAWAERRFGWPCDTTELSNIYGPKTKQGLFEFRGAASAMLGEDAPSDDARHGPPTREDWGLVFDVMRAAIAEDLECSAEEALQLGAQIEGRTRHVGAAGEKWPRRALAHLALPEVAERRVEILAFRPDAAVPTLTPTGHADEIYAPDARLQLRYVAPERRTFLVVSVRERGGDPCPDAAFEWRSDSGIARRGRTDRNGRAALDDVPAGPFTVTCFDEQDVMAKIWAQRLARGIDASDLAEVERVLRQPSHRVRAALDAYDGPVRGGGPGCAVASLRSMVESSPAARTIELLFARAGLPSSIRFAFLSGTDRT